MVLADRTTRLSNPDSITPECKAELAADARPPTAPFGPALPLEPIDSAGRINGDVVYVADLGDRNDVRRERFKDRTCYRVAIRSMANGSLRAEVVPY